jgi:hypothetical protein
LISSFQVFPHSRTQIQEYRKITKVYIKVYIKVYSSRFIHQGVCFWILLRTFIKSERVSRFLFLPLVNPIKIIIANIWPAQTMECGDG